MKHASIYKILIFQLFFVHFLSCCNTSVGVRVELRAMTNDGLSVKDAQVLLNNRLIGRTDSDGKLSIKGRYPPQSTFTLKIEKESDDQYIAPYVTKIATTTAHDQLITVNATLFSAPKSQFPAEEEKIDVTENPPVSQLKTIDQPLPTAKTGHSSTEVQDNRSDDTIATTKPPDADSPSLASTKVDPSSEVKGRSPHWSDNQTEQHNKMDQLTKSSPVSSPPIQPAEKYLLYTIYAHKNDTPVENAAVYYGDEATGSLKEVCRTNARGRCNIHVPPTASEFITFIIRREGYHTASIKRHLTSNAVIQFQLIAGPTLDIFALTQSYNYIRGVENVEIQLEDSVIGKTDKFGHVSFFHNGKDGEHLNIGFEASEYIPQSRHVDFVLAGSSSLVSYFIPASPPKAKIAIMPIQVTDHSHNQNLSSLIEKIASWLNEATRHELFERYPFAEVPPSKVARSLSQSTTDIQGVLDLGWQDAPLKAMVDAFLISNLIIDNPCTLELSLINSKGIVVASARERLELNINRGEIRRAIQVIAEGLARKFPFEGAITDKGNKDFTVNLGERIVNIRMGDLLNVYSPEPDATTMRNHRKVALARFVQIDQRSGKIHIEDTKSDDVTAEVGQIVELRGPKEDGSELLTFKVADPVTKPVSHANVYMGDMWLGATDRNGILEVKKSRLPNRAALSVLKNGYRDFNNECDFSGGSVIEIPLTRETAVIRIETNPSGAKIVVNGKPVGNSPVILPVPSEENVAKVEISNIAGYKTYSGTFQIKDEGLDLTGLNQVVLEKDHLAEIDFLLNNGKVEQAVNKILRIIPAHSDYLTAQYRLGEIYLTMIKKPALAAKAFHNVTIKMEAKLEDREIFKDALLKEGIALVQAGDYLKRSGEDTAAIAHYQEAIKVFDREALRVTKNQQESLQNELLFHRALAFQQLWLATTEEDYRSEATKSWGKYINIGETSPSDTVIPDSTGKLSEAKLYLKQLTISAEGQRQNANKPL